MKRAGLVSCAVVMGLIVLGSIAVAAPSFRTALHAPGTGVTGASGPGGSGSVGGRATDHVSTEDADEMGAPDFSGCEGSTGLDNAVCRHEALLADRPGNVGLQNSLERLRENRDRHEAHQASKAGGRGNGRGQGNGNAGDDGGHG